MPLKVASVSHGIPDTLIVWTEPDGTDYALSFQDIEGCGEVWEFIGEVQRHLQDKGVSCLRDTVSGLSQLTTTLLPLVLSAEEEAGTSESVGSSSMHTFPAGTMHPLAMGPKLPMPALGNMHDCERVIKQINRQPHGKEKLFDLLMANVSAYSC
jgi:protein phosphatase 4 regulatory subunit 3